MTRPAVLDASTLLAAASADEIEPAGPAVRAILPLLDQHFALSAPAIAAWEIGNVIHVKRPAAYGRSITARKLAVEATLTGIALDLPNALALARTSRIAESRRLSFYAAAYVELAARESDGILITEDTRLLRAARSELGTTRAFSASDAEAWLEREGT